MTPPSEQALAALAAHARGRTKDSRRRIQRALREMRASQATININTVARKAKVSRRTIYNNPDLRDQIHAHRHTSAVADPGPIEPTIVTALRSQLTAKDDEIKRLKAVVAEKNTTIARLHGHIADLTNAANR